MDSKEIMNRYEKSIKAFKSKMNSDNKESIKLTIKGIRQDRKIYSDSDKQNKINLGVMTLAGLFIIACGFDIGTREFAEVSKDIISTLAGIGFGGIGIYAILKGLGLYHNNKLANDAYGKSSVEFYEKQLENLDREETINARTK